MDSGAKGYPDGWSDCSRFQGSPGQLSRCNGVPKQTAFDPDSKGYSAVDPNGHWLQGVYTRVHRDDTIVDALTNWLNDTIGPKTQN